MRRALFYYLLDAPLPIVSSIRWCPYINVEDIYSIVCRIFQKIMHYGMYQMLSLPPIVI